MNTYTRTQAMQRLGTKSPANFHQLRRLYPGAFVVIEQGHAPSPTLYDAAKIDRLAEIREELKQLKQPAV